MIIRLVLLGLYGWAYLEGLTYVVGLEWMSFDWEYVLGLM